MTLRRFRPALVVLGLMLLVAPQAVAKRLPVTATTSSTYPPEESTTYEAKNLSDGKASTAWVEGEEGSGLGAWVELDLGGEQEVSLIKVWAGMWYSRPFWERGNRPKQIEVKWSDDTTELFTLTDEMKAQELRPASPKRTSKVRLKVQQVHNGSAWHDTGISEIQVFDTQNESRIRAAAVTASSTTAADADGSYDALHIDDGLDDTMWCEGSKDGDGTGEWLDVRFDGTRTVSGLHVFNGIGTSMVYWFKGNRATSATLTFSDGSTATVEVPNKFKEQVVPIPPKSTSSVKIRFDAVARGKEYNDLCISEAYFTE